MEIWTVEPCQGGWAVVNEGGEFVRSLTNKIVAEDWLAFKQEAAEMNALASYTTVEE